MTRPADRRGPFADGIDTTERASRSRTLAALARASSGLSADPLVRETLRRLERDPGAADEALKLFDVLPTRPEQLALCAYAAIHQSRCSASESGSGT